MKLLARCPDCHTHVLHVEQCDDWTDSGHVGAHAINAVECPRCGWRRTLPCRTCTKQRHPTAHKKDIAT